MAVNVANAFLYVHERNSISSLGNCIHLFRRFIDDLFLIIASDTDIQFLRSSFYNELPAINLKWTSPSDSCVFLDLQIFKYLLDNGECTFHFRTYQKPRNTYLYIPFSSDHPKANLKAFIKAELMRYNRTNSYLRDILEIRELFWVRLRKRGYPTTFLRHVFTSVAPRVNPQSDSVSPAAGATVESDVVFCTTYHPHFLKREYALFLKEAFSSNAKIYFRKSKRLFH